MAETHSQPESSANPPPQCAPLPLSYATPQFRSVWVSPLFQILFGLVAFVFTASMTVLAVFFEGSFASLATVNTRILITALATVGLISVLIIVIAARCRWHAFLIAFLIPLGLTLLLAGFCYAMIAGSPGRLWG